MMECETSKDDSWVESQISYVRFVADRNRAAIGIRIIRDRLFKLFEGEVDRILSAGEISAEARQAYFEVHWDQGHLFARLFEAVKRHIEPIASEDGELGTDLEELRDRVENVFRRD